MDTSNRNSIWSIVRKMVGRHVSRYWLTVFVVGFKKCLLIAMTGTAVFSNGYCSMVHELDQNQFHPTQTKNVSKWLIVRKNDDEF